MVTLQPEVFQQKNSKSTIFLTNNKTVLKKCTNMNKISLIDFEQQSACTPCQVQPIIHKIISIIKDIAKCNILPWFHAFLF